jgi:tRNA (cmo5U34)-methyltransferase
MALEVWKKSEVAEAFLTERSLLIPDRHRQLSVLLRILKHTAASIPLHHVVDLGTGDGILLSTVLEAFPQALGCAVDFSPPMLQQARAKLARLGSRATVLEGDLSSPNWKAGLKRPFDAVISGLAIHHLPDDRKRELYREIHALLNEGGVFVNTEHVSSPGPKGEELFNDAMTEHLFERRREKGEAVTQEQVRRDYLERADRAANILASVNEQCEWLRQIGFRDVDCFWKYFELAIFGGWR